MRYSFMKKVLIIGDLFHTSPRFPGIANYMKECGWEPVILTPDIGQNPEKKFSGPDNLNRDRLKLVETNRKKPGFIKIKKLFGINEDESFGTGLGGHIQKKIHLNNTNPLYPIFCKLYWSLDGLLNYPDHEKEWEYSGFDQGRSVIQDEKIDAMISSSSPVTTHLIARRLKDEYNIPWIAELRDLWSQNDNYPYGRIRHYFDTKLEIDTLKEADALVTVSVPLVDNLKNLHQNKLVHLITNGFDPLTLNDHTIQVTEKLTFTYTGQIYPQRDYLKILHAMHELLHERLIEIHDIEIRFYGPYNMNIENDIKRLNLGECVKQHGVLPRNETLKKQCESQVLLFFNWDDPKQKGTYSGKIFEYLAAQRPILSTGGYDDDVISELLRKTQAGINTPTIPEVKKQIIDYYNYFKLTNIVPYNGKIEEIMKYSYRECAKKYGDLLNSIL